MDLMLDLRLTKTYIQRPQITLSDSNSYPCHEVSPQCNLATRVQSGASSR